MTKNIEMQQKMEMIKNYIYETVDERGCPPTIREICYKFDIKSTSSASYYLRKLEEAGELRINKQKSRGLEVTGKRLTSRDVIRVPLVGSVTAGIPKLAVEDNDESVYLPQNLFSRVDENTFMLTVEGTSMIDIGINDGDKIIVKQQPNARNGQVIVALIGDEMSTVKRFYAENGKIRLHPENKFMQDKYYDPEDIKVLGIVVGLIRTEIH
ncbi:MAG: transcriptional repressor LexA [Clostridia bacterium]|nr:transcriptional repressor LexA [Clostridia bacterium]